MYFAVVSELRSIQFVATAMCCAVHAYVVVDLYVNVLARNRLTATNNSIKTVCGVFDCLCCFFCFACFCQCSPAKAVMLQKTVFLIKVNILNRR